MPALLIKNGRVIDPASGYNAVADVWIEDGVIKGVGPNLSPANAEVFDASGLIVAPGFIDMHVHLREPGFEHSETIESGHILQLDDHHDVPIIRPSQIGPQDAVRQDDFAPARFLH